MENKYMQIFIFTYTIFTLILMALGITSNGAVFKEVVIPSDFSLTSVISFVKIFINYVLGILIYTTANFYINVILLAFRILAILELLLYVKRMVNPLSN